MKKETEKSSTLTVTAKFLLICLLLSVLGLVGGAIALLIGTDAPRDVAADASEIPVRVVIDAGHGGEDGGAVGVDGTLEKNLNLAVSEIVYDILSSSGVSCAMTRTEDIMLYDMYDDLSDYKGHKKVYDLKNRLRFAKEHEDAVFVSIHMNTFGVAKYSGLQVYYSPNHENSEVLAECVRASVATYLQTDNERETKPAGSSIYILDRIEMPAVLIECGFISNPDECRNLSDPEYQRQLALTVSAAVMSYLSSNG